MTSNEQELSGQLVVNRYQIAERLGVGGMGEVYRALDTQTQQSVAIKFLLRLQADDTGHRRFQREIRHLQELRHPHIVAVHHSGEHNGIPFFVMDYIAGGTLRDYIRHQPEGRLKTADLPSLFVPLLGALNFIHSKGFIHRDLKPQNVMLASKANALPHITLMDFGLARRLEGSQTLTGTGTTVGTAHYMSPEQVAGLNLDARADLYSIGVMLYEAVTGTLPFEAPDTMAVMLKHINTQPLPPSQVVGGIPAALEQVILRLMEKTPVRRYASADEVISLLRAFALLSASAFELETPSAPATRRVLQSALVGRQNEIAHINQILDTLARGPLVLLVKGERGTGKSRLLEEVNLMVSRRQGRLLHSGCLQSGEIALEPIVKLVRGLRDSLELLDLDLVDRQILSALFPELGKPIVGMATGGGVNFSVQGDVNIGGDVVGRDKFVADTIIQQTIVMPTASGLMPVSSMGTSVLPPDLERARLFDCLTRLFIKEAATSLLVWVIDDLQWADASTLDFLLYFARRLLEKQTPLLICGSLRLEDLNDKSTLNPILRDLDRLKLLRTLELTQLGQPEIAEMLISMLGHTLPELAQYLYTRTDGNPLFAEEFIHALVATECLRFGREGWEWDRGRVNLPNKIIDVIQERITSLNITSRKALSLAALIGREFDFDILTQVSTANAITEDALLDSTDEWLLQNLVKEMRSSEQFKFTQNLVQEVAANQLRGPRLSRAHSHIAHAITTLRSKQLDAFYELLADHYLAAGDKAHALEYLMNAGEKSATRYAYVEASALFQRASQLLTEVPEADRELRVKVYESLGITLEHAGQYGASVEAFIQAGTIQSEEDSPAGHRHSAELERRTARILQIYLAQYPIALRHIQQAKTLLRDKTGDNLAIWAAVETEEANIYYRQGDSPLAETTLRHVITTLQDTLHTRELATALNLLGTLQDEAGHFKEAAQIFRDSIALWTRIHDEYERIRTQENLATALWHLGDWQTVNELDLQALAYWEKMGDPQELAIARNNHGDFELQLGNVDTAEKLFTQARDTFVQLNTTNFIISATINVARARLAQGELMSARWMAETACKLARENNAKDNLAEGLRVLAQIYSAENDLPQAQEAALDSLRLAREQQSELHEALAERVLGTVLMETGAFTEAKYYFEHTLQVVTSSNVALEIGRTHYELARWYKRMGDHTTASKHAREARRVFSELGARLDLDALEGEESLEDYLS